MLDKTKHVQPCSMQATMKLQLHSNEYEITKQRNNNTRMIPLDTAAVTDFSTKQLQYNIYIYYIYIYVCI